MNTYKNGLHKLLNDEIFWSQYTHFTLNIGRHSRFREYRTKGSVPKRKTLLNNFIIEDYIPITKDHRPINEIALELVSPVP